MTDKFRLLQTIYLHLVNTSFFQHHPETSSEEVLHLLGINGRATSEKKAPPGELSDAKNPQPSPGSRLILHTDGASRGNPGPAGIGVVLQQPAGSVIEEEARYLGKATNNAAEYRALLRGLELALKYEPRELEIYLDSELVVKQLTGEYQVRHPDLKPLYLQVKKLLDKIPRWRVQHVPRAGNRRADQLANQAIDQALGRADKRPRGQRGAKK